MPVKKSELYSSLWASCDELRGGMDASQYKDYVLVLLFLKYISDKYADLPYAPIKIPKGASFKDMVDLKGKPDIGDLINKKIIGPLTNANSQLSRADFPDFNDPTKLGDGKEKVERLTNLIAIFENNALDFSKNRAGGDDILGDAYEYLMRHFATESGKSKGQFYTPAAVSRVMAQVIGIRKAKTSADTTVYDPTCGSGSLLLKVGDEAGTPVTLYGQEKDSATSGLARMNMILHNNPTALITQGNTLTDPKYKTGDALKVFDFIVANPPFSDKRWSTGLDPLHDPYERFKSFGVPPTRQGDYAYLLHIVRSLKSTGKGACILPHGVLFRGNAEADIRRALVRKGYIKGIIGLPANLFYGTGIPACIVVIDKKDAQARKGIFMIDARGGYIKDGPKNRLRARDIHKIVDVFEKRLEVEKYSRMVPFEEIERNEFNLNLPRYIDSQELEDIQDITGHLQGGIPIADIDALRKYWDVCPGLRETLFKPNRQGYFDLVVEKASIKSAIYDHPEFVAFIANMTAHFDKWRMKSDASLKGLETGFLPKELISSLSEDLLEYYTHKPLIDRYDVYQHLMDYWEETMQDDCYLIAQDDNGGWKAETYRIIKTDKKGKEKDKGWTCDLVPKQLIIARYYPKEQADIDAQKSKLEAVIVRVTELEEEHGGDEGALQTVGNKTDASKARIEALELAWRELDPTEYDNYQATVVQLDKENTQFAKFLEDPHMLVLRNYKGNITLGAIRKQIKVSDDEKEKRILNDYLNCFDNVKKAKTQRKQLWEVLENDLAVHINENPENETLSDIRIIDEWLDLKDNETKLKKLIKETESNLDAKVYAHYQKLLGADIKELVVNDKWFSDLNAAMQSEMERVSHKLTQRVKELSERYETPLPQINKRIFDLEEKVSHHLKKMGFEL